MAPAAILVGVAAVAAAAGAVVSGIQQAEAAEFQSEIAKQEAELARRTGLIEEAESRRRAARLASAQRAAAGASGLVLEEGSPLEILAQTAEDAEFEALNIRFNSEVARTQARNRAKASQFEAKQALTAGAIGGGTALLTGGTKALGAGIQTGVIS